MAGGGKGPLRIAIEDFIETHIFGSTIAGKIRDVIEAAEDAVLGAHDDVFEIIDSIDELPESLKFKKIKSSKKGFQGGVAGIAGFGASLGMSAASSFMAPFMRMINYRVDGIVGTARVDPAVALAMERRTPELADFLLENMLDLGWKPEFRDAWRLITLTRLPEQSLVTLVFRQVLERGEVEKELERRGWAPEDIPGLFEVAKVIPPPNEIIRLAVREAFNPEAISKFELDSAFPAEVGEWSEKVGLSADWAMKYWIAHWENPSLQMGFEMLHRLRPGTTDTPFTADDLDLLMKIQDVAPYWRPRLKAISYAPYTRVDVRRMFGAGVLTAEEVKSAYLDLGYDEEHATNLTAFTTSIEAAEEKGISRAAIQQAYERKVWTREQASAALADIGFTAEQVEFWLSLTDWEIEQTLLKDEIEVAQFLYVEGELDEGGVYSRLGPFNLPAEQTSLLIRQWDIKRLQKIKLPSEAQLEDFYRRDIITFEVLKDTLTKKGYSAERLDWLTRRIDLEQAEAAAEAAERAQKEAERLDQSTRAKDYQRTVAGMQADIANLRLAIANLKVSKYGLTDPEQIKAVPEQITVLQAMIAELLLSVSEERVKLLSPPA
jgi:hypothetical protein